MVLRQRRQNVEKKSVRKVPTPKSKKGGCFALLLVIFAFISSFVLAWGWHLWVERRHYTPFPAPKVLGLFQDHPSSLERLWGTYRPHLYFGMRTKTPTSLLFSLMWFSQNSKDGQLHLRYSCEQSDSLPKYGWLQHDGVMYGEQGITDDTFKLKTVFMKRAGGQHGGDWTARITAENRFKASPQVVSLLFVVTTEGDESFQHVVQRNHIVEINGRTNVLGSFKIKFMNVNESNVLLRSFLASFEEDVYDAKQAVLRRFEHASNKLIGLPGDFKHKEGKHPNFFVHQVTFKLPSTVDVVFESGSVLMRESTLSGVHFTQELQLRQHSFNAKFEKIFMLKEKGFLQKEIEFAKAGLSNMIGGIGYFHGRSLVKTSNSKEPYNYWTADLLTGVPSRSFFPRGFLWDEGFHQLLIQRWDSSITKEILAHWLDLLNHHGWIPREQILGVEARRKVPDEFVVQHHENANPPTFFLTIQALLKREEMSNELITYLQKIFPRLVGWFEWYNNTQHGRAMGVYRWHGRDESIQHELNPKTLTSGLDDYPRASHPSVDERHLDLRCWIAIAAGTLADLADVIGVDSKKFRETELFLKDNTLLDKLHWSSTLQSYADYGNHTSRTKLEWKLVGRHPNQERKLFRQVNDMPSLKFVNEFGYVSIFPFLLKILQPTSPKLEVIMRDIYDPKKLWTPFGLRSLSKSAPTYNKKNTEHDQPYWRGPIWLNINYLAIKALHHYSESYGPYQEIAKKMYIELRSNLIHNLHSEYKKSGYIWEQYNDITGRGQGCYPFTGWSALVTLIMAEL